MTESVTGVRGRTRRAILAAAAAVLARDRAATVADIARAADVGRSTVHRYFPERDDLVRAVVEDSLEVVERAGADARLDQGTPLEALRRLIAGYVAAGDRIRFLWGDPDVLAGHGTPADDPDCPPVQDPMLDLVTRGQAAGVLDPDVEPVWVQNVLWALVYTGVELAEQGVLPRHGVVAHVVRTFENGVLAR
ncbi:TetR/AcrR family transcriptional regulator [Actinomadura flavalba]|uniref:TetR/AcrR family transcriptional regulator n=1 Tax=Actinomadura flavalba TaxID=1120938 RepID=UPI0005254272|nr:TetR/AcrR family transcriptional regulator [Actinomadura flavalba]